MSLITFNIPPKQQVRDKIRLTECNPDFYKFLGDRCRIYRVKVAEIVNGLNFGNFDKITLKYHSSVSTLPQISYINNSRKATIHLPYIFLIKPQDIPAHFLDSAHNILSHKVEELFHWTHDFVKQPREAFDRTNKFIFHHYLAAMKDPAKLEMVKLFILGHEVTHFVLNHPAGQAPFSSFLKIAAAISLLIFTLFRANNGMRKNVICTFFLIQTIWRIYSLAQKIRTSIKAELEADAHSAKLSNEARIGGQHFFQMVLETNRNLRKISLFYKMLFDSDGNTRLTKLSHGSETSRLRHLSL